MICANGRPTPPPIPGFSRDMETALVAVARASSPPRPARAAGRAKRAAASIAGAAVAAAVGAGIYLAVGNGQPAPSHPSAGRSVHIHVAAFWVDTSAGGTVTVTLLRDRVPDPGALRRTLAEAGVPALVTVGSVCYVPVPSAPLSQVVTSHRHLADGDSVITIVPSAIPAGWKLSIGYFAVPGGGGIYVRLVPEGVPVTCTSVPPTPPTTAR